MTAHVTPAVSPTPFDHAVDAAWAAGWVGRAGFDACVLMLAAGIPPEVIEARFLDCVRRLQ